MPKLPIVGNIERGPLTITVLAGAAVGGYMWYRHNKNKQAAQQATQTGAGDGSNQYGYGSSSYGYGSYTNAPYGYGFGPYGLGSYGYGNGGNYFGYGYYGAGTGAPVPQQAQTNAQWSQAAVSALTGQGYSGQEVLGALGVYLTGGNLNQNQIGIVQAAIAAEGYPPTSGPGGFPPAWHTAGTTGGGQGGGDGNPPPQVNTTKPPKVTGLTAKQIGPGLVNANWDAMRNTTGYVFQASPPDKAPHDIGDRTGYNAGDVRPGIVTIRVAGVNAAGQGPFSTKRVVVKTQQIIPGGPNVVPGGQRSEG